MVGLAAPIGPDWVWLAQRECSAVHPSGEQADAIGSPVSYPREHTQELPESTPHLQMEVEEHLPTLTLGCSS